MRKSSTVLISQHDKGTDDYKIILNFVRKMMKNEREKRLGKAQNFLKYRGFIIKLNKYSACTQ